MEKGVEILFSSGLQNNFLACEEVCGHVVTSFSFIKFKVEVQTLGNCIKYAISVFLRIR